MTKSTTKKAVADPITGDEVKLQDELADSAAPLIDHLTEIGRAHV